MELEDVRVISLRNEERKKKYCSLDTGMFVEEQLILFERRDIAKIEVSLVCPVDFTELGGDERIKRYPSLDRPEVILGDEDRETVFSFSALQDYIPDEQLKRSTVGMLKSLLKAANPAVVFSDEGTMKDEKVSACWFDFKSYVVSGPVYNIAALISANNRTVLGMFSCPYNLRDWWKDIDLKILGTFQARREGK